MSKNTNTASKSLRGTIYTGSADFNNLAATSLRLPSDAVSALVNGVILNNVIITNSQIDNSIIGSDSGNAAFFTTLKTISDVTFLGVDGLHSVYWNSIDDLLTVNGNFAVNGCATIGNIEICKNTITPINSNGDLNIIPNKLGTLYLTGPINNTLSSFGNFYSNLANGNVTFIASDYINLTSNKSSLLASTFSDQTFSTINGNFNINTDTTLITKTIINISENTNAKVVVTTLENSNLRVGDYITLSGTNTVYSNNNPVNGKYLVSNIIDSNNFLISTSNILSDIATKGSLLKSPNNNINLNASQYITIPSNIPITFGITNSIGNLNSISGNTSGIVLNAQGNIILSNPDFLSTSGNYIVEIPQYTKFQYGTNGNNNINFDGKSLKLNSYNNITLDGIRTYINTPNLLINDSNPLISNYTANASDLSDRGIQFNYSDTVGNMKLGWFGYKKSTEEFTFLTNATNNNKIFTGTFGKFNIGSISVNNITFNTGGILNMNCGIIQNVKLITGCSGVVNINASSDVNISTSNRLSLMSSGDIYIPNNIKLTIGTSGTNIFESTNGSLMLTGSKNLQLFTQINGSVIIPIGTKISFDNTSIGNQSIVSDTIGNFYISTNKNLVLNLTNGNLLFPSNNSTTNITQNSIQFGYDINSQIISGNTNGINILSNSSLGTLNLIATSNVNISNSSGNILLNSLNGDINLYATNGNVRILPFERLIFNNITGNTTNSIRTNTVGNFMFYGPGTNNLSNNSIEFKNAYNLNLNVISTGNINIPTNVYLNLGNYSIINDTTNNLNIMNNSSNGNLNTFIKNNINTTSQNFNLINNNSTNISTPNFIISATTGSQTIINSTDLYIYDPNPVISNYISDLTDISDKGIQYRFINTSGNMRTGWFGYKQSSGQFTYYSDALLNNTTEVISGTLGQFLLGSAVIKDSLSFLTNGNLNMNCGTISNLNTILGCNGTLNINASSNINASATNILLSTNNLKLPYTTPISFGNTQNSISVDTNGNMILTSLGGSGLLVLNGNVQINGTTENVYSTVTNIQDPVLSIGGVIGPIVNDTYDRGIEFKWYNTNNLIGSIGTAIGFFGFQNSTGRFEYIPSAYKSNNIYSGSFGNVQFGNGYFNNLDVSCGTINNINTILGCNGSINIISTTNINFSSSNLILPFDSKINFGNTTNSISANTFGNFNIINSNNSGGINFITSTNGNSSVNILKNTPLNLGSSSIIQDTLGNLNIINSFGNLNLTPSKLINGSYGSVIIPTNNSIIFSGTNSNNRISSDGSQLNLYGYSGIGINTSTLTIAANVNIIGTISANSVNSDTNQYILPLGTSQINSITKLSNVDNTSGNILVTTQNNNYLTTGDSVILKNTNSVPIVDGNYIIISANSPNSFIIKAITLTTPGSSGSTKSVLTYDQHKDVGIAVDYWSTVGNTNITSGSAGYKTGFFGWQNTSQRWVFYNTATISNDVVTGSSFGNIQINELYANKISGFQLDGALQANNFIVSGTNFQINGGLINNTPIGQNIPQLGTFTSLISNVSSSLTNLTLQSTLQYSIDRYTLNSSTPTRNPNNNVIISFVSVSGTTFDSYGTMGNLGILDGQAKKIIMSSIETNCTYTLFFGINKLITPNSLGGTPKQILFKRQGQSCELIFDASLQSWILTGGTGGIIS